MSRVVLWTELLLTNIILLLSYIQVIMSTLTDFNVTCVQCAGPVWWRCLLYFELSGDEILKESTYITFTMSPFFFNDLFLPFCFLYLDKFIKLFFNSLYFIFSLVNCLLLFSQAFKVAIFKFCVNSLAFLLHYIFHLHNFTLYIQSRSM